MSRKAIIIESSNVVGESDLPGARVDQKNWINFLKSELGGAWEDSEIIPLTKPLSSVLEKHLEDHKDKYCFVAFSGHGCDGSIVLNDSFKSFPISRLKPRGEKGSMVVDSCRGVEAATQYSFAAKQLLVEGAERGRSVIANSRQGEITKFAAKEGKLPKRFDHSVRWRRALLDSKVGIVEMLACSKGEAAGENPKAGGFYTSLLLQSADLWQQAGGVGEIHSTRAAHDHAARKMPPQQTPEYKPQGLIFPFAVSV